MIHHISIAAHNPQHVAEVLARVLGGKAAPFNPHAGSYMASSLDEYGTMIEVYPADVELAPGSRDHEQTQFHQNANLPKFSPFHAAISVSLDAEEITQIATQTGWRVLRCNRGSFEVMEFWIENHELLELLTPEMASQYLNYTRNRNLVETLTHSATRI